MNSHTMIQALIYLGAAALIVPVAVRLGLGSVLGYLIAGCVIGPWGFRLVTDAESILHFAEIGVVLMLFVIGLELDPQRLWKLRASVFGGGALQMLACGMLLGGFCILLGMEWKVAELIGMTLALSSTAIAMQAMNERNLTVSQMGRSTFSVLLFQDIAAIPLVAMIPLLATSGASTTLGAFALSALKVVGALALVILLGRYVTRPLLRFVARSGLREVFSAVALFLVFGFGLLLEEAGLSMAMGAFLAGVLLASSEYRHALESLGLGAYEARERADLFRRFNHEMVEEMVAMASSTATERAAVFKRTSTMLTEIINEDRNHLSLVQRHGWQGTEEGKHTGDPADEPESKPSA